MIERVWPDAFVEPNNLAQQFDDPEALDGRSEHQRFIDEPATRLQVHRHLVRC